jgi:hypothetical protein
MLHFGGERSISYEVAQLLVECAESETDFLWILAHLLNQALILENRQLLSKGPPIKTTTRISQLFPTKPLIAGLLPDLSGSANAYIR